MDFLPVTITQSVQILLSPTCLLSVVTMGNTTHPEGGLGPAMDFKGLMMIEFMKS